MINIILKIRRTGLLLVAIVMGTSITPASAMLNPAAVYCGALGYEYVIETTEQGGQVGKCRLPNDQVVNAWDFLRGLTALEWSYCAREGYEALPFDLEICGSCTVCVLPGGIRASAIQLMNVSFEETTCGDGSCGFPENFETCPQDCPSGGIDEYCDGVDDGKCDFDCQILDEEDPEYQVDPDCFGDFDTDGDGVPDSEDNCPDDPDKIDPGICGCGVADLDSDSDGTSDCHDKCRFYPNQNQEDDDNDEIGNICDNCPNHHNPEQVDTYPPQGNGCGDACECEGNFDGDADQDGSDAFPFKVDFGRSSLGNPCVPENPCNGNFNCDQDVDGSDAFIFKEDFGRSSLGNPCPECVTVPWCE